jgi:hypothetical protein
VPTLPFNLPTAFILLPQRLPAAVETSIGPAHYPAECTHSDAFLQPSLRARKGRANSNSFSAPGNYGNSEAFMDDNRSGKGLFRARKRRSFSLCPLAASPVIWILNC